MHIKSRGIVLHTFKYSDNSYISGIYSRDLGRVSFIIQGIHAKKSKYKPALFQPLTIIDIEINQNNRRDLQRLNDVSLATTFHSIHSNPVKNAIALFIGEILYRTIKEGESNEQMFNYISNSIEFFEHLHDGIADFHLVFLTHLSKYLGFFPQKNYTPQTPFFDMKLATFTAVKTPFCIDQYESQLFWHILEKDFSCLGTLSLNKQMRHQFLLDMIRYYRLHLQGMGAIHSVDVLGEVFE